MLEGELFKNAERIKPNIILNLSTPGSNFTGSSATEPTIN